MNSSFRVWHRSASSHERLCGNLSAEGPQGRSRVAPAGEDISVYLRKAESCQEFFSIWFRGAIWGAAVLHTLTLAGQVGGSPAKPDPGRRKFKWLVGG